MKIVLKGAAVRIAGMVPEMVMANLVLASHWPEGFDMVLTSANDSHHSHTSLHYAGAACDWRSKHLPGSVKLELREAVNDALGDDFDFLLEDLGGANEHFHLEFQPKRR